MIYVFLANGFEEIEALTAVDLLRRASLPVQTVGVGGSTIVGAHQIPVIADIAENEMILEAIEAIVLPGGMPGTTNLADSTVVQSAIDHCMDKHLPVGAICAAPSILGKRKCLIGHKATCFPGFEEQLIGAELVKAAVVTDSIFTTASGAGVATDFALELVARLASPEKASEIRSAIQCP